MSFHHAGVGFPNGAVKNAAVFALPSPDLLMLATEGRYHHDAAVRAGKRVLWRAIPRIGKRPAELGWSPVRFVAETINLTDAPELPITDFVWANELDLNSERGDNADDYQGLENRYRLIGGWAYSVVTGLKQWSPSTRIHWPAWTPDHQALDYLPLWREAAGLTDCVDFHAYNTDEHPNQIEDQYVTYRAAFPNKHLALTEWHCKGDVDEERRVLAWLAETMVADPLFDAAYFFIWRWGNHPVWWSDAWDIEHSPARLALFRDPPVVAQPAPVPEPTPEPEVPTVPERDPYEFWSAIEIANASGIAVADVRAYWPKIHAQLVLCGIGDRPVQVAAIGTCVVESSMRPIHEYGTEADWAGYSGGAAYAGRGFIQLTHDYNYQLYGAYLRDLWGGTTDTNMLIDQPDLALDPDVAAAVLALYFVHHTTLQGYSIPAAARAGDWEWVRRLVQGGVVGLPKLIAIAGALGGATVPTATLPYNPDAPCDVQPDDWSCSVQSTQWLLRSIGRNPGDAWMEQQLVPGIVSKDVGLLNASGEDLAAWINREYGAEMGFEAHAAPVTFDDVLAGAGTNPTIVGGRHYGPGGHWVGIRRADENGWLELANPAPNYQNTGTHLDRQEWDRFGPWSAIYIDRMGAVPAPVPIPTPTPEPSRTSVLLAEIRMRLDELERIAS